jgi:hypothetical protein
MAIATKNGVPIIQSGRITTACSCCTPCLPIEERTFRGQQYGDNIYTISVPPQAGQFTFTNVQCGAATGAGSTCFNWPITYRVKAGGVVLHEAGCVGSDIVLCKPEGVTSIEVNIFVHQPTGQFAYCLGQISFPRGLARIGCLDTRTGACCNGTTCTVKPQCQCNAAAGEVFKGVGTVCSPNPCDPCCQGALQPSSLLVQIIAVDRVSPESVSLSFPLIGSYVLPASPSSPTSAADCFDYADVFFANPSSCFTQAYNCLTGCTHKLQVHILSTGQFMVGVCDSQATFTPGGTGNAGGHVWGFISNWGAKVCNRTPVSGTTTHRNDPNFGGVLNAVSYSISFQ